MKYPKYFSLKMNREKSIFHFEKQNLELVGNSVHTTEYLAFAKVLLARLYLKVKVYITKLLGVYIIYKKSHTLNEVRDCQQITFVTLNGFCPLNKKDPSPLFLTDNIKTNGIPTKME